MIIHRYIPYEDSPDPFDPNDLMARVGEFMMKYQIDLDEALQLMLASGQIPNLFIKEAGMTDFIEEMLRDLEEEKNEILKKYDPQKNIGDILKEREEQLKNIEKYLKKIKDKGLKNGLDLKSQDGLFRIRWALQLNQKYREGAYLIDDILGDFDRENKLNKALKTFDFTGKKKIAPDEIDSTLAKLFSIEDTMNALNEALANGDFKNLDMNKLRKALGQEKLEEFLELQQRLVDHMKEILEKRGFIETDPQSGESKVSSSAIDFISSKALTELYENLETDNAGSNIIHIDGDTEQVISATKDYQFGDNLSHIDWPASLVNALIKGRKAPKTSDMEVYRSRATAKNAMVILLDMSGSMYRYDRFYQAKKMIFALDKLMKKEYPDDRLEVVGFGSLAKRYSLYELFNLQPFPVIYSDPLIRLKLDLSQREENSDDGIPLYFTNLQRGLTLARGLLGSRESRNRQIVLITDGVPTAHMEGSVLHLNYPPNAKDFDSAISEAKRCREEGIIINTFLLSSEWWENFSSKPGERTFAQRFVKATGGRFFQTHPHELGVTVLYDFITGQKKMFGQKTDPEESD